MKSKMISLEYRQNEPLALAIGFFDGLHLGHQTLIEEVMKYPTLTHAILTFTRNLKSDLNHCDEELLLTDKEREEKLLQEGIEEEFILPFDEKVMHTDRYDFLSFLKQLHPTVIVVGEDFRFGDKAEGDSRLLSTLEKDGIKVVIKDILYHQKKKIASSTIRNELKEGNLIQANNDLGYPFYLTGKVIHGLHNGHQLGYPTANITYPEKKVKLPCGVYKANCIIDGKTYLAMVNIGSHPTIDPLKQNIVEANILDFNQDIYGKEIKIEFHSYLRKEKKFTSVEELKEQLKSDLESIKKL